ncbi:MAG TPA: PqqD family protein [Allosphingosinicella sp.]|nr:PqqD family protein [Allosphingosinicella sp.]
MAAKVDGATRSDETIVARAGDLTAAHIETELVIMHIGSGKLVQLNRVATRIWENLDPPIALGALYARIEDQFDVAPDTCRAEVGELLAAFEAQGLITMTPPR